MAEIVAQQVEDDAGFVGVADRDVAGSLHPEIDVGVDLVVPMDVDDEAAGRFLRTCAKATAPITR